LGECLGLLHKDTELAGGFFVALCLLSPCVALFPQLFRAPLEA
jgi:hypothetical protein